ncbi:MAG: hypothetical protein KC419_10380, partial [Anaerolineales bacterium]|nr:hypothetical protein [Anaerolineales bacterium]
GAFLNSLVMEANVVAPDGKVTNLLLQQVAPGRYEAAFMPTADGAYFIRVAGTSPENEDVAIGQTSGWVLGYSPEYAQFETNPQLLEAMAELTGGRVLTDENTAVFDHTLPSETATRPIWSWLTLAAVLLLPLDIAVRRLVITRRDWQRVWAATFGRFQSVPMQPVQRTEQVSRLFQAKQRAGTQREAGEPAAPAPAPIQQQDAAQQPAPAKNVEEKQQSSLPKPGQSVPVSSGSLASRLLEKKRQQSEQNDT